MAITGTPGRSYYDGYEQRRLWTVEAIERWLADCKKRRARYMGKTLTWYGKDYKIIDMVFTDPGLVGWVLYQDGDDIKKIPEGHSFMNIA